MTHEVEIGISAETLSILREYLQDEFVLTARNKQTLCGYWEITEDHFDSMACKRKKDLKYHETIRLSWPEQSMFDLNYTIHPVSFSSHHEYLPVPVPGLRYTAELGWLGEDGSFIPVLVSNRSEQAV